MKIDPACIPCALRRTLATAERISDDPWLHHKLLAKAMSELVDMGRDVTPADLNSQLWAVVSKTLGTTDPYQQQRQEWRRELEGGRARLKEVIAASEDGLLAALQLSARANVFDNECATDRSIRKELQGTGVWGDEGSETQELSFSDYDLFLQDLDQARSLIFVHDSGPEMLFDALLIRQIRARRPKLEIVCVVRARPILLDATQEDLEASGLLKLSGVRGVDPGIDTLGVPLNECSRELREEFEKGDLVLGKGQASFETLADAEKKTYFLMRVKCAVMAKVQGVRVGDLAFVKG